MQITPEKLRGAFVITAVSTLGCLMVVFASCGHAVGQGQVLTTGSAMSMSTVWPLKGGLIGISDNSEKLEIWNGKSGRRLSSTHLPSLQTAQILSPTLAVCVDVNPDSAVQVIDLPTGKIRRSYPIDGLVPGHGWGISTSATTIAVSPSGHLLAWVENEATRQVMPKHRRYRVTVVDLRTGKQVARVEAPLLEPCCQEMATLAISSDETTIAVGSCTGEAAVGIISIKSQKLLWQKIVKGGVWDIAFHPDGKSFFTTDDVGQVIRYEAASGKVLSTWMVMTDRVPLFGAPSAPDRVLAIDVSPDGKYVAAGTDYTHQVIIWDIATSKRVKSVKFSTPIESALAWAKDGSGVWAAGTLDKVVRFIPVQAASRKSP